MRKILLCISIITLFCFSHCHKDPQPDPNSFYFQCKIDGQLYIPSNCANCMVGKLLGDTLFLMNGNNGFESVLIGVAEYPFIATNYTLDQKRGGNAHYDNSPLVDDIYKTDSIHTGQLNITSLNPTSKIITGTFSFQAYNTVQNKTVNITEGKFRINYITN